MMHNHNHGHCAHNIRLCTHCDVVYCATCGKEWEPTYKGPTFVFRNKPFLGTGFHAHAN